MAKRLFKMVFFMCLISCLLYANDAVLVTDLSGEISASCFEPVTGVESVVGEERGRIDWQVELADMLSAGTRIKTGLGATITLIHLVNNVEYRLGAESQALITDEGVEGQNLSSEPVRLVSTNLGLGSTMQHQVGAVVADQIIINHDLAKELERVPSSNQLVTKKSETIIPAAPVDQTTLALSITNAESSRQQTPGITDISRGQKSIIDEDDSMLDSESDEQKKELTAAFALPRAIFDKVCSSEQGLQVEGYDIRYVEAHGGWVDIHCIAPIAGKNFDLNITGDKGYVPVTLHVEVDETPSIALAWRLEESGLLAQAASMWLSMEAAGMDSKKIAVHLKRIKDKLRS